MKETRRLFGAYGRLLFVLFILISAFVFAMFQGGTVSWTIFYTLVPFLIYSLALFFYPLSNFTANRMIRTPEVQNNGKLIVTIAVKRRFRFPLLYALATEKFADREITVLAGEQLNQLLIFGLKNEVEWEYEIEKMPRGEHVMEGVEIEVSDFFGWIRKTHFIPIKHTVLVYPKVTKIYYSPMTAQYDQGIMASPFNMIKDTTMATGVRDYQSGDRVTWIHWKSFARTQSLMTKEFEDRKSQELLLVLDGRPSKSFEAQVEFAASILKEAQSHQAGIGFLTTGSDRKVFPSIETEVHLQQAFVHLAKIKPTATDSTDALTGFGSELQHVGRMVLITGSPDWPFIQSVLQSSKNVRSVVCFVVIGKNDKIDEQMDEAIQLAKMRGIMVYTITPEEFPDAFKKVASS